MGRNNLKWPLILLILGSFVALTVQVGSGGIPAYSSLGSFGKISPTPRLLLGFSLVLVSTVLLATEYFKRNGEYAHVFYLLALSAVGIWIINMNPEVFTSKTLRIPPLKTLELSSEVVFYTYTYLLVVLVTAMFLAAPRRSKELGFLTFGMTFSAPLFRQFVYPPNLTIVYLVAFTLSLGIASTVFSPNLAEALLQTVVFATFSVVSVIGSPWNMVLPVAFVVSFPRRKRNLLYLLLVFTGIATLNHLGFPVMGVEVHENTLTVMKNIFIPVLVVVYSISSNPVSLLSTLKRTKGHTVFLAIVLITYVGIYPFDRSVLPYAMITLSLFAVRMIKHLQAVSRDVSRHRV